MSAASPCCSACTQLPHCVQVQQTALQWVSSSTHAALWGGAHLRLMALRFLACHSGRTAFGALSAFLTCDCMAAMGSTRCLSGVLFLLLLSRVSRRHSCARGGVCVRHCRTAFMKQVLPRFTSPDPCGRCSTTAACRGSRSVHAPPLEGVRLSKAAATQPAIRTKLSKGDVHAVTTPPGPYRFDCRAPS